eukprot:SAG31_NODE_23024_length_513_cov_0.751208_1_plen_48_part_01
MQNLEKHIASKNAKRVDVELNLTATIALTTVHAVWQSVQHLPCLESFF